MVGFHLSTQCLCLSCVFQNRLYKIALGMSVLKKKNRKASCVFIALAITCRAKRVTSVSSSKQPGNVYSRRPNSRRLTQEPLHRAWLPLRAFNSRRPLLVSIGSNKERSDGVFTASPPLGPWANAVGLVGRVIRSETQRGSVAS